MHPLLKSLFIVMVAILVIMAAFESAMQMFIPGMTLLESHVVTVLFAALTGTAGAGYALMKHQKIKHYLCEKVLDCGLLAEQEYLVRYEKLAVLGQITGSVGYELRKPLDVISNAVYFLQSTLPGADDTTREYLGIIKEEIVNAERIVSELMDFVRTKAPRTEIVDVRESLEEALRKCVVSSSVTVKLDIPATLSPVRADTRQIHQVFRNLISNGVEAMPEGGVLEISAVENQPDKTIAISVGDGGTGIAPGQMAKLFQPLYTTKPRGIGLGLVVVKNLTQANGGSVVVQSELGKGSTFTVKLPRGGSS